MKICLFNKRQNGFTLLELIIAIAIGVVVLAVLGGALYQILAGSGSSSNSIMAIRQVQNTGYWVSMDVQQSSSDNITVGDNPSTADIDEQFTIIWDTITFESVLLKEGRMSVYRLDGSNLFRDYYTTETMTYETPLENYVFTYEKTTLIAQYIDTMEFTNGNPVKLNVSAYVEGWKPGTAERTYEIETRVDVASEEG